MQQGLRMTTKQGHQEQATLGDWRNLQTTETYLGRNGGDAGVGQVQFNQAGQVYKGLRAESSQRVGGQV